MRHWTQDGAHVASEALMTVGMGGILWRGGWEFVALCVAGVFLSCVLSALDARNGWKQATEALAKVQAHEERLAKVEKEAEEAKKQSTSALNAARISGAKPNTY